MLANSNRLNVQIDVPLAGGLTARAKFESTLFCEAQNAAGETAKAARAEQIRTIRTAATAHEAFHRVRDFESTLRNVHREHAAAIQRIDDAQVSLARLASKTRSRESVFAAVGQARRQASQGGVSELFNSDLDRATATAGTLLEEATENRDTLQQALTDAKRDAAQLDAEAKSIGAELARARVAVSAFVSETWTAHVAVQQSDVQAKRVALDGAIRNQMGTWAAELVGLHEQTHLLGEAPPLAELRPTAEDLNSDRIEDALLAATNELVEPARTGDGTPAEAPARRVAAPSARRRV